MTEIVKREYIFLQNTILSKEEAFHFIAKKAVDLGIGKYENAIFENLSSRESEASTGLMNHIAIPHAVSNSIDVPAVLFIRSDSGLSNWETFDGTDVKQIIAMLVPEGASQSHLQDIARISTALLEDENINIINTSVNESDIYNVLNSEGE